MHNELESLEEGKQLAIFLEVWCMMGITLCTARVVK
jgi:hypothetical protein